jgi:hypothetical protein
MGWTGPEQRKSPRIAVLMRVRGELVDVRTPIIIHDLSRTGFAVVSRMAFPAGESLDFRLEGGGEPTIAVTARAVHTRPFGASPNLHLSGFEFVPGPLTGLIPQAAIDRLFEAMRFPDRLLVSA